MTGAKRENIGLINGGFINLCRHIIENGDNKYATKCRISII